MQLGPNADDAQQDVSLFLVAGVHEAGQVEGQRLHKGVEQLLAAAAARGVGDGQAGIFALALHHHAVGQCDLEVSRSDSTVPLCGVRTETVPAQGPRQGVQHAGLALIVVAAHEGEPGGRRGERNGLDALDVFGLKGRNGYRHCATSPLICPLMLTIWLARVSRWAFGSLQNCGFTICQVFSMERLASRTLS